jgi:hypothetical protein
MGQGFGIETPSKHHPGTLRQAARLLVVIESGGAMLARLFLASHEQIAEFDAGTEETVSMTSGLSAVRGANGPEWDRALAGHSVAERAAAEVYLLPI